MTDLEITKLCAEAMGYRFKNSAGVWDLHDAGQNFNPLHDDEQAMELVKQFHIAIGWNDPGWGAFGQHDKRWVNSLDLNRAICECVARMQSAK